MEAQGEHLPRAAGTPRRNSERAHTSCPIRDPAQGVHLPRASSFLWDTGSVVDVHPAGHFRTVDPQNNRIF